MIYVLKWLFFLIDRWGSSFVFNRELPPVGTFHRDRSYGPHEEQVLDVLQPVEPGPHPVVIYIHGGGLFGSDKHSYSRICRCFASAGAVVFNLNYRLTPKHRCPAQMQDVAAGIAWALDHAEAYGGDPRRVYLVGDSAGAQLASWYAAAVDKPALHLDAGVPAVVAPGVLQGLLFFYGSFDMESVVQTRFPFARTMRRAFFRKERCEREQIQLTSPARHISPGFPPTFLCVGTKDPLYPETLAFEKILAAMDIPYEALYLCGREYPGTLHGFLNFYARPGAQRAMDEALAFLRQGA